jgi:hypothetical protein
MRAKRTGWRAATALVTMTTIGAGSASAADRPASATVAATRRLVVSIPDRKLALIENDMIVSIFPVAVGAVATPSPAGTFTIVNRIPNLRITGQERLSAPAPRTRSARGGSG